VVFIIQLASGFGSLGERDYTGGGVAWFAHVGGFVAGMLLIRAFPPYRESGALAGRGVNYLR